ncbi:hypothetical protein ACWGBV_12930 [Streptomyces sp. NPDC055051]
MAATGRPVAVAALNAGVGEGGAFLDTYLEDRRMAEPGSGDQ